MGNPLHPAALSPGDAIAVIAPAGMVHNPDRLDAGIQTLRSLGYRLRLPASFWPGSGYLAGTDENRAAEFNSTWADPGIKALLAARGGYGCLRILDKIDLEQIRKSPKLLIGFSDITVLQTYLQQETGLVSMHGPVATSLASSSETSRLRFAECLAGNWRRDIGGAIQVLESGNPRPGILSGGNLSSIVTLLGTRYAPDWKGKIIFLEDTNEPPYRVDRMLTQLYYAGMFNDIVGLILGDFSIAGKDDDSWKIPIRQRALELTRKLTIPIWADFPIGHGSDNATLPIGAVAFMNNESRTLQFF